MRGLKIVGLGDSTTAGTPGFQSPIEAPPDGRGDPRSQYAYWMMQRHPDWEVLNRGINRQRTDEILLRVARDVIQESPQYVILLAGVNDVYQGRPVASIEANLDELYRRAAGPGLRLVLATILPFNGMTGWQSDAIRELNRWITDQGHHPDRLVCDTNRVVADPSNPDRLAGSPDGYHPDVEGYRRMGERLSRVIEDAEAVRRGTTVG
jgi:lysophospholipase L1-like esterase